jgi:hypothetical protein
MSLADLRAIPYLSVSQLKTFFVLREEVQYIEKAEPAFRGSCVIAQIGRKSLRRRSRSCIQ